MGLHPTSFGLELEPFCLGTHRNRWPVVPGGGRFAPLETIWYIGGVLQEDAPS